VILDFEEKNNVDHIVFVLPLCRFPYPGISGWKRGRRRTISNFLNEKIFPVKNINMLAPNGEFYSWFSFLKINVIFLGSWRKWITPIMADFEDLFCVNEPNQKWGLCSIVAEMRRKLFSKELEKAECRKFLKDFTCSHWVSPLILGLELRVDWQRNYSAFGTKGAEWNDFVNEYFICGPDGIMESTLEVAAVNSAWPKIKSIGESFYSACAW